jgi:fumarate reductase subunit D
MTAANATRTRPPMKRRLEPFVWLGFSGGGVIAAILLPVLAFLFALALPLGWVSVDHDHLLAVAGHPLTAIILIGVFVALLIHAAHRFRYTLYDGLQIKRKSLVALVCYGAAVIGSFASVVVMIMVAVALRWPGSRW